MTLTARALYGRFSDKLPLKKVMTLCALLCVCAYLAVTLTGAPAIGLAGCALCGFSVGIFWPGTFSVAAVSLPQGGTAMYALMALAGDVGCSGGPTLAGLLASYAGGNLKTGLLAAVVFPLFIILGVWLLRSHPTAPGPSR